MSNDLASSTASTPAHREDVGADTHDFTPVSESALRQRKGISLKTVDIPPQKTTADAVKRRLSIDGAGKLDQLGVVPHFNRFTREEIAKHNTLDDAWVVIEGRVYNITSYIASGDHPGGTSVFKPYLGQDATKAFRDIGHSCTAEHILSFYFFGYVKGAAEERDMVEKEGFLEPPVFHHNNVVILGIDLSKPVLWQVYRMSKQGYVDLAKEHYCSTSVVQLFETKWLEPLSRTAWWVIPLIWLPVSTALALYANLHYGLRMKTSFSLLGIGMFLWTFLEYLFHRFVFHFDEASLPDHGIARIFHFLAHGFHHLLPMDPLRLVMPPALLCILVSGPLTLALSLLPWWLVFATLPGVLYAYVCYDMMHYGEHHFVFKRFALLAWQKNYHMKHHFKEPLKGFGVSNPLWDYVFGTAL